MKNTLRWPAVGALAILTSMTIAPMPARADSTQSNKNTWRNLGIGAGAIAAHGLLKGNSTEALLGAAGAAYSANRYEQERKSQDARNRARGYYHRSYSLGDRKYYWYNGHEYYLDRNTGERHQVE